MTQVVKARDMLGERDKASTRTVHLATEKVRTCSHQIRAIRSLWWKGVDLITDKEISRK